MWKESYSIGVEHIDNQHRELFRMVERLLNSVQDGSHIRANDCASAIGFLKAYTLRHFKDEEAYQWSINYPGIAEHIKIHRKLVQTVAEHEQRLAASNYGAAEVRDFIGMLIGWLVCHVAGDDQLLSPDKSRASLDKGHSPLDSFFYMSTCDILSKLIGISMKDIRVIKPKEGILQPVVSVEYKLVGDISGVVTYNYTSQLAFNLMHSMAAFSPFAIDEIVRSAMMEISNFTSVKSIGMMSARGLTSSLELPKIKTFPALLPSQSGIILDTGRGLLELDVAI